MAGRKSLFEPVAEKLIAQIREGRIAPGDKMPSEHELCSHYALSRSSIRKVLDCLEQKGLIRRQPGIGTFVCGNEPVMKKPVVIAMPELPPFSYAYSINRRNSEHRFRTELPPRHHQPETAERKRPIPIRCIRLHRRRRAFKRTSSGTCTTRISMHRNQQDLERGVLFLH